MRAWVLPALLFALCGCATSAEREFDQMRATAQQVDAASRACWAEARAQPAYAVLFAKLALSFWAPPTLDQRTDPTVPTPEDARLLADFHRDWLLRCRRIDVQGAAVILPGWRRPLLENADVEDAIYASLALGEMTWGAANTRLAMVRLETVQYMDAAHREAMRSLDARHAAERQQRGGALSDLAHAMLVMSIAAQR